jgi:hypothetical protein
VVQEIFGKELIDQPDVLPVLNLLDHQVYESAICVGHFVRNPPSVVATALTTVPKKSGYR